MARQGTDRFKRRLVGLALILLLFLGTAFGLGLAFLQGTGTG